MQVQLKQQFADILVLPINVFFQISFFNSLAVALCLRLPLNFPFTFLSYFCSYLILLCLATAAAKQVIR